MAAGDISLRILLSAVGGSSVAAALGQIASVASGPLVNSFSLAASAAVIGLGVYAVRASSQFQAAMLANESHAGLAASQINTVTQALLAMGPAVGQGPTQLAQALYPILSGFSGITNQAAKTQVSLAELNDAAMSVAGTTANVTDVSFAATAAFNAFGLATNNAAVNTARMNNLFDIMNATVTAGNMQWSSYSMVIGKLSVSARGAGVSFIEANSALADLTNSGYTAQLASTYLSNTFTTLYLKADATAKSAAKLGLSFDETKYKSLDLAGKIAYLNQVTGGNQSELLKLLNGNTVALRTFDALSNTIGNYKSNLDSLKNSQGATAQAFQKNAQGFSFAMQQLQATIQSVGIAIGAVMLPALTNLAQFLTPLIGAFAGWISNIDNARPILIGLGVAVAVTLIPVMWDLAAATIAATWPFLLIAAAVAALVAIFVALYQHNAAFHQWVDQVVGSLKQLWQEIVAHVLPAWGQFVSWIKGTLMPALQQAGQWITGVFQAAWKALVTWWNGTFVPQVQAVASAFMKYVWPVLLQIGQQLKVNFLASWQNLVSWWNGTFVPAMQQLGQWIKTYIIPPLQQAGAFIAANFLPALRAIGTFILTYVWPVLQQIGSFIVSSFTPVWKQLVQLWQGQLLPLFKQLWGALQPLGRALQEIWVAIQPLMPAFKMMAELLGGIVIVVLGILVGVIQGVISGLAGLISGIITVIGGIVQMFTGVVQVISGIVTFLVDLFTGHFDKLKSDLGMIWQGIINIFAGAWQTIVGLFQAAWGLISGIVVGFVQGVIGFFTHLWNELVGHSIIPDMINGIVSWFAGLPGKVMGFISTMVSNIISKLASLASQGVAKITAFASSLGGAFGNIARQAIAWGSSLINGFLSGLQAAWGAVVGWVTNALSWVSNHFPHSPVKMGPLVGSHLWGANLANNIVAGMRASLPLIHQAASDMAAAANTPFASSSSFASRGSFALNGSTTVVVQPGQAAPIYLDKRQVGEILFNHQVKEVRVQGGVRNR